MLFKKGDASCVKMIDFGLSKDFSGQESMKTMSGSVSLIPSADPVTLLALLHRPRGVPVKLQPEDRHLVSRSRPLHHALRESPLPWQLRARNHRQRYQR
jgi:hypothetical protein